MKKTTWVLLPLIMLVLGMAAYFGFPYRAKILAFLVPKVSQSEEDAGFETPKVSPSVSPAASPTGMAKSAVMPATTPTSTPAPTKTPQPQATNTADLQSAIRAKYGAQSSFSVDQNTGQYAQGTVSLGSGRHLWWLAASVAASSTAHSLSWKVVADGTSYVNCGDIANYNFPRQLVPMCWSSRRNTLISL